MLESQTILHSPEQLELFDRAHKLKSGHVISAGSPHAQTISKQPTNQPTTRAETAAESVNRVNHQPKVDTKRIPFLATRCQPCPTISHIQTTTTPSQGGVD